VVVVAAEQGGVVEIRFASRGPGVRVVGLAPGRRDGAAVCLALVVPDPDGPALRCGVQAAGAAQVEDFGSAAEHGGQDLGLAGEAPGLARGPHGVKVRDRPPVMG
jgi:hypothetical protein